MELKKTKKADLQAKKVLFFETGLAVALIIILVAFNWKSEAKKEQIFDPEPIVSIEEENTPITQEDQPKPQEIPKLNVAPEELIIGSNEVKMDFDMSAFNQDDNNLGVKTMEYVKEKEKAKEEETEKDDPIPFMVVEDKPTFNGGDANLFPAWVNKNIQYPEAAADNNIQGVVYIAFTIGIDGNLTNIRVIRPVDPLLDNEALRVVKSSPKWKPGKQRNKPVPVTFQFPVRFQLAN